jgi:EAL domain-containing protein (putative c-di-GMP-specific phosphodiesterase class I)
MRLSYRSRNWKERLKMFFHLPFSDASLKYFPPDFILRDPVLSLIQRERKQGSEVALILLKIGGLHHLLETCPASLVSNLREQLRVAIKESLFHPFSSDELIGVREFSSEDVCIFIKQHGAVDYDDLLNRASLLSEYVGNRFHSTTELSMHDRIELNTACYVLDTDIADTYTAIEMAHRYANAIASKRLPAHFCRTRKHLQQILGAGQIHVVAQPIVTLQNGEIFGWEFLTRGPRNSPFHRPNELFEMAHQADLLSRLEFLVLCKVFSEIKERQIKEQVFVNVTPISLSHPLFHEQLMSCLRKYPMVQPSQIIFEITERHSVRDFSQLGEALAKYRKLGIRFAVDDAGSGYSSLQSITELIPDMIKIDKSVIQNIDRVSVKQSMLKALMAFAENINCQVIAEGIEREEEADVLFGHSVMMGQGFYFAKPEPYMVDNPIAQLDNWKERIKLSLTATSTSPSA